MKTLRKKSFDLSTLKITSAHLDLEFRLKTLGSSFKGEIEAIKAKFEAKSAAQETEFDALKERRSGGSG